MTFNPDLTKQAQEVIFNRKNKELLHSCLLFNNVPLRNSISEKHLRLELDFKLNFVEHIKNITQKLSKTMDLLRSFQPILLRSSLLTIYKTFLYMSLMTKLINLFREKLESLQYNACVAITGAIRGTSSEEIFQELGFGSLKLRRWFRKVSFL